jgi:hypothetical protein
MTGDERGQIAAEHLSAIMEDVPDFTDQFCVLGIMLQAFALYSESGMPPAELIKRMAMQAIENIAMGPVQ